MRRVDLIKSKSLDEFAEFLDKYGQFDGSPWIEQFNERYCNNCEPIMVEPDPDAENLFGISGPIPCSYCELEHKCKFFPDMEEEPHNKDIIKMWLEENI